MKQVLTVLLISFFSFSYAQTIDEIKSKAESGDIKSQYLLGYKYYKGEEVEPDTKIAFKWFLKCAEQGNYQCQSIVADFYKSGQGVDKNDKLAFVWYQKAAKQGSLWSQYKLGMMYFYGWGVESDKKLAFEWFMKAKTEEKSWPYIARCYAEGKGTNKNIPEGLKWYLKSAEARNIDVYRDIAYYYEKEAVVKDLEKAFEWKLKSAEVGESYSQYEVGMKYLKGEGVKIDSIKGIEWLVKAGNNEDSECIASKELGTYYYTGTYVDKNYTHSAYWFKKAAEEGCLKAYYPLAYLYYNGIGTEKNYEKSFEWCKKAVTENTHAWNLLGLLYLNGQGVEQDFEQAYYWFKKAAEEDIIEAQYQLGKIYFSGQGTQKNTELAKTWLTRASKSGHKGAKLFLSENEF